MTPSVDLIIEQIVEQKLTKLMHMLPEPDLRSVKEAADYLRTSEFAVYQLVEMDEQFPAVRLGLKNIKVDFARLPLWIKGGGYRESTNGLPKVA